MSVVAIDPDYESKTQPRDPVENFHGNVLIYVHWEEHNSFCSAVAFPVPLSMKFGSLIQDVIFPQYSAHPDAAKISWDKVIWSIDGTRCTPDLQSSLEENGIGHKSLLRFWTPNLSGLAYS